MFRTIRRLGLALAILATLYCAASAIVGIVLMEHALHLNPRPVTQQAAFARQIASLSATGVLEAQTFAQDGAILRAWYVQPTLWNGNSVLLLHGVGDNREGVALYANLFLAAHDAVLLPDSRAHGQSGGLLSTYGLLESGDLGQWSLWLAQNQPHNPNSRACNYLFGESMGAAIALEATTAVPRLCAVVAEAPFSSFRAIAYQRIAQSLRVRLTVSQLAAWPAVESAFLYARLRYGLDFSQASPERKLAQSRVPALLIAGLADTNIPPRHAQRIAAVAASVSGSQLWLVPGAGHTLAASAAPRQFEQRVLGWLAAHNRPAN